MIVEDLTQYLEREAVDSLLLVNDLQNHVTFPTNKRGVLLDPVLSDLTEASTTCQQLGLVGSSDHHSVPNTSHDEHNEGRGWPPHSLTVAEDRLAIHAGRHQ